MLHKRGQYLAWINLIFCLFIIVWGAWVRLSGSGAGCGDHWPLCNGQVIPLDAGIKTFIEYTHRFTTGIFGITILLMLWFSKKDYPKGHYFFKASLWSLILTIIESLIGAFLVKKGLVENNQSDLRALVIAIHLANTFFLMAALMCSVYFSSRQCVRKDVEKKEKLKMMGLAFLLILVGASGAITALGNTLFPESSLLEGIKNDFDSSSHFLIRLRIFHPALAILTSVLLFIWTNIKSNNQQILKSHGNAYTVLIFIAVGFGALNWLLMAPVWGALLHLLIADFLWLGFVGLSCSVLCKET